MFWTNVPIGLLPSIPCKLVVMARNVLTQIRITKSRSFPEGASVNNLTVFIGESVFARRSMEYSILKVFTEESLVWGTLTAATLSAVQSTIGG